MAAFGTIHVQLDKGGYAPNEQVNGTIYLNLMQNFIGASEVWITISGTEETHLIERKEFNEEFEVDGRTETRKHVEKIPHHETNSFVSHRFQIYKFPTPFVPAGQYSFPVSFVLPKGLPSSFSFSETKDGDHNYGKVSYVLRAMVGSPDLGPSSIRSTQEFNVNQELGLEGGNQKKQVIQQMSNCCASKGTCQITAYFEKTEYFPGDIAFLVVEVDNTHGQAPLTDIKGKFTQTMRIHSQGYSDRFQIDHHIVRLGGLPAGSKFVGEQAKRLQLKVDSSKGVPLQPTSRGKLISNEYFLEVVIEPDTCCDCSKNEATANLKLSVRNRDLVYPPWTAPPNWAPQIMGQYTAQFTSEFALPPGFNMQVNIQSPGPQMGMPPPVIAGGGFPPSGPGQGGMGGPGMPPPQNNQFGPPGQNYPPGPGPNSGPGMPPPPPTFNDGMPPPPTFNAGMPPPPPTFEPGMPPPPTFMPGMPPPPS